MIWKDTIPLKIGDDLKQEVMMPVDANILTAQLQDGTVTLWFEFVSGPNGNPSSMTGRKIEVLLTGCLDDESQPRRYIATVQSGSMVFHIFERL